MEDPESNRSEQVPTNRAQVCFRMLLWLMPAVFGVASLFGLEWLHQKIGGSPVWFTLWCVLTPAFALVTGWFNAVLAAPTSRGRPRILRRVVVFFLIQLLLTPALWSVTAVVAWKSGLWVIE